MILCCGVLGSEAFCIHDLRSAFWRGNINWDGMGIGLV